MPLQSDPYRPRYHFSPTKNWMNDPNGLILPERPFTICFFQYNPEGDQWGNISWGHAVSTDLMHWEEWPVAIPAGSEMIFFRNNSARSGKYCRVWCRCVNRRVYGLCL